MLSLNRACQRAFLSCLGYIPRKKRTKKWKTSSNCILVTRVHIYPCWGIVVCNHVTLTKLFYIFYSIVVTFKKSYALNGKAELLWSTVSETGMLKSEKLFRSYQNKTSSVDNLPEGCTLRLAWSGSMNRESSGRINYDDLTLLIGTSLIVICGKK